jgi:hypothetical protein
MRVVHSALVAMMFGCGVQGSPTCVSKCGMRLFIGDNVDTWTCESHQRIEDATVAAYAALPTRLDSVVDNRFGVACELMDGVRMYVIRDDAFMHRGIKVSGYFQCDGSVGVIGGSPPAKGAYAHEIAHLVQNCDSQIGDDHPGWAGLGVYRVIDEISLK